MDGKKKKLELDKESIANLTGTGGGAKGTAIGPTGGDSGGKATVLTVDCTKIPIPDSDLKGSIRDPEVIPSPRRPTK